MSSDVAVLKEMSERERFLEARRAGTPAMLAAHEVGWTPRQLKREMADADFAELVEYAIECRDDAVEKVLYEKAYDGNMSAIQLILLNRRSSEFKDVKRIEVHHDGAVRTDVVHSIRDGLLEAMRASSDGIAALQPGGILDVESEEVEADEVA